MHLLDSSARLTAFTMLRQLVLVSLIAISASQPEALSCDFETSLEECGIRGWANHLQYGSLLVTPHAAEQDEEWLSGPSRGGDGND